MPTLSRLRDQGAWGRLRSIVPPITVPGLVVHHDRPVAGGARHLRLPQPARPQLRPARVLHQPGGHRPPGLGAPLRRRPRQSSSSAFPAPIRRSPSRAPWWPASSPRPPTPTTRARPELKAEIEAEVGPYILDVEDFRSEEKARVGPGPRDDQDRASGWPAISSPPAPWEFFMLVDMGRDRLQHGFWAYAHPDHRNYQPDTGARPVFRRLLPPRSTGSWPACSRRSTPTSTSSSSPTTAPSRWLGGFCINEWLRQQGYLGLKQEPDRADADGRRPGRLGAHGRLGRRRLLRPGLPQRRRPGAARLRAPERRTRPCGRRSPPASRRSSTTGASRWATGVRRPRTLYPEVNGIAPDLIAYFGDLRWRAAGDPRPRPGSTPSRTTPAPTTPTTPSTASSCRRGGGAAGRARPTDLRRRADPATPARDPGASPAGGPGPGPRGRPT